jgi:DNA ligase (NAD+)
MQLEQARHRAEALRQLINKYNHQYYVLDDPSITDNEYDVLMRELVDIEIEYPKVVIHNTPAQRVGAAPFPGLNRGDFFNAMQLGFYD